MADHPIRRTLRTQRFCETCEFWNPPRENDREQPKPWIGTCHRNPPPTGLSFPTTTSDDWCGEYQAGGNP